MNNYPNREPDKRRGSSAPRNVRGRMPGVNSGRGQAPRVNGAARPQNPRRVQGNPPRSTPPKRSGGGWLSRVAAIWIAVLAVLLLVIMVISFACGKIGAKPASGTVDTGTVTTVTTEVTTTYPVDYAKYTDDTLSFSSELEFANGILIDIENGEVIASRGGDSRIYPASMTKVMTLIVAAENAKDLDETFTMTAEITDPLFQANASVAGFLVGEEVTVRDLIYGLILPSGGDGAMGLAEHIAGSEAAFAEMMNAKAKELGLRNTHFTNCTGLHSDDHYSTCHEIAMIVEYAIQDEFMREVLTTYQYTTEQTPEHPEGILLTSTILSRMDGGESGTMFVQGGKTGYTTEAKNCLASFATPIIPGMSEDELKLQPTKYILVTAGNTEKFGPVFDAIAVYKSFSEDIDTAETVATAERSPDEPTQTSAKTPAKTSKTSKTSGTSKTEKTSKDVETEKESIKIYTAAVPS